MLHCALLTCRIAIMFDPDTGVRAIANFAEAVVAIPETKKYIASVIGTPRLFALPEQMFQ